jgi:hypothetical protein
VATSVTSAASRLRNKLRHALAITKFDLEYSLILVVAALVAVLTLTNVITSIQELIAVTLSVLSLMAFSALRHNERRNAEAKKVDVLDGKVADLATNVSSLRTWLESTQAIMEIPGGPVRDDAFTTALTNPTCWHFRGCTGSFLRAATLGSVASSARKRAPSKSKVTVQILDPTDDRVCTDYATYRSRMAEQRHAGAGRQWTVRRVRHECVASLIATIWYSQHENLDIEVGLLDKVSTLRYDISDTIALITNENKDYPALAVTRSSALYNAIIADLDFSLRSARPVRVRDAPELPPNWKDVSLAHLRDAMERLGLDVDLTDLDQAALVRMAFARNPEHIYPRG